MPIKINNANDFRLEGGRLSMAVPAIFHITLQLLISKQTARHGGYGKITVDVPFTPRSTGEKSQNHHLHGHLRQLAIYMGHDLGEMKQVMKFFVPEWPVGTKRIGGKSIAWPVSEADVSSAVEAAAIEWCHRTASDNGWTLKEGKE